MSDTAAALALTLFPTLAHHELGIGPYVHDTAGDPFPTEEVAEGPPGLDVRYRHIGLDDENGPMAARQSDLRVYRGVDGVVRLDRLNVAVVPLMGFRARPVLGEPFSWSIGSGRIEAAWVQDDTGTAVYRLYSPLALIPIGLSNTDQDDDRKLKYHVSALGGFGVDVLARLVGPVGLHARLEGGGETTRRFANNTRNNVRHEVTGLAEAGVAAFGERRAWMLGAWLEHVSQWEPRDVAGHDGVDRQYVAGGVRLAGRFHKEPASPGFTPDDLQQLLDLWGGDGEIVVDPPPLVDPTPDQDGGEALEPEETVPADEPGGSEPDEDASEPEGPVDEPAPPADAPKKPIGPTP